MNPTQMITLVSGILAFSLNFCLLPIILFKSSDRLGTYKFFLFAYTLNAMIFAFTQICILPTWYIPPNGYIFTSTITVMPRAIQQLEVIWFITAYTMNTVIVTLSFFYRLSVIDNARPWLLRPRYMLLVFLLSILTVCYMIGSCWPLMPSEHTEDIFRETMVESIGIDLSDMGYIGGEITIDGKVNASMFICLGSFMTMTSLSSALMIYCWTRIGAKLQELRRIADRSFKFQYKLYILLSCQTIVPIIFNLVPAFIVFILSLAKIPIGNLVLIFAMVLSFAQIMDPVLTVFFVADYKEAVRKYMRTSMKKFATRTGPLSTNTSSRTGF